MRNRLFTAVAGRLEVVVVVALLAAALLVPRGANLGVLLLGVGGGAGLALNALGMVLVYRSNRIINLAQVQFGATAAVVFAELAGRGLLLQGLSAVCTPCAADPGVPLKLTAFLVSLLIAVAVSGGLAWATYRFVVRRLDRGSRLVVTIASIGIAQALAAVAAVVGQLFAGSSTQSASANARALTSSVPPPVNPSLQLGGIVIGAPLFATIAVLLVTCAALTVYLRRSRAGAAVRATSENPQRAQTLGIDVVATTARVWLLAGLLSGAAACLAAMTASAVSATTLSIGPLAIVLAVAVLARFTSLPLAALAGLVLGVLQAVLGFALTTVPHLFESLLVVIIAIGLAVQRVERGRGVSDVAASWLAAREVRPIPPVLREVGTVRSWITGLRVVGGATLLLLPWILEAGQTVTVSGYMVMAMVGLSLLVLTGWAGQISLGQYGVAAVGAWVAAVLAASAGLNMLIAIPLGGIAGGVVSVIVGLPSLRLRGLLLAVMTLGFALAVSDILLSGDYLGTMLPSQLPRSSALGINFDNEVAFFYFTLAVLSLTVFALVGLRRSRSARVLLACRENEAAAQSLGISVLRARILAFAVSGVIAGTAGALLAYDQRNVDPLAFTPDVGVAVFLMTVIGGLGSLWGPLAGAAYLAIVQIIPIPFIGVVATGIGVVALLMFAPGGLVQIGASLRDSFLRRVAMRNHLDVPGLLPDRGGGVRPPAPIAPLRDRGGRQFVPRRYRLRPDRSDAAAEAVHG